METRSLSGIFYKMKAISKLDKSVSKNRIIISEHPILVAQYTENKMQVIKDFIKVKMH